MLRQYIGARYVPIVDGVWDSEKVYEPLTIVNYPDEFGASYTSKKFVPAGIAPTDNNYWALTGAYNAQISVIQNEVDALTNDVNKLKYNIITPEMFGAVGDGVTDDYAAITDALNYAKDNNKCVMFLSKDNYFTSAPISINCDVLMRSNIIYNGEDFGILVGSSNVSVVRKNITIRLRRNTYSSTSKGVQIVNAQNCNITLELVWNYGLSVELVGDGTAFAYNNINIGLLYNANNMLKLVAKNNGWINENKFYGGRMDCESSLGIRATGILIRKESTTTSEPNNNVFHSIAIENQGTCVKLESARYNSFYDFRTENSTAAMECDDSSIYNHMTVGYGIKKYIGNILNYVTYSYENDSKLLCTVPVLIKDSLIRDIIHTPSGGWGKDIYKIANSVSAILNVSADKGVITVAGNFGYYISCSEGQIFTVHRKYNGNNTGRVIVVFYDGSDNVLDIRPISSPNAFYKQVTDGVNASISAIDSSSSVVFEVPSGCTKMFLGFAKGSGTCKIENFSIYSNKAASIVEHRELASYDMPTSNSIPGMIVMGTQPNSNNSIGWVYCEDNTWRALYHSLHG